MKKNIFIFFSIIAFASCQYFVQEEPKHAIARVGEQYLFASDIAAIMPKKYTTEDSTNIVKNYINNWAINQLLLENAQRNIPEDKKAHFEKLVDEYRSDLYTNAYKEILINNAIDTIINKQDMSYFYEKNKDIFTLNESLIKLRYVQFPKREDNTKAKKMTLKQKREIEKQNNWQQKVREQFKRFNQQDIKELDSISIQFPAIYLNDSTWVKTESVIKRFPFLDKNINESRNFFIEHKEDDQVYLIQVKDVLRISEQAPMDYMENALKQIILNQRKLEFVKKLETDILNSGIKKKQFEIYE
ncbi:peptidyl-prolyl cis-trans isomerase [Capnocytophaga canimorsus]|uniref:peptidyl-prolyl cis-trans isomerase n=1 Tax=Capnocytophaga canimorsus TaxID=28188 RepID=UPI000F4EE750|nr:peptidyl-prolyl cis-trans isomerase [Capnocytophaga canimorsus]AYW36954.1 peptidyl-prolyl cis-trans isomerase [Capnocytophaga canimorsus]MDT9499670.1 peptidyl-prolyl cis-trans isomerase [Capnocytophaga canimorsus]